uniref:Rab-GAP TBC domain-containing protein n=1 Tax=Panagrolaimus superbus TaxID=310955 RepID=A0A914XVU3_9BILA
MKKDVNRLESEMDSFKKEYVFLLQSCVRIPLYEHSGFDVVQVKLFGGDVHEHRVRKLLAAAREVDPTLPTFESLRSKEAFHIDEYGFRHYFEATPLALHYICTMLHQHYQSQSDCYVRRKQKWQMILNEENCVIENNHESRLLCRAGIPRSYRSKVWRALINQHVADIKSKYGNYYYRNLCQSQGTAAEKQYINVHQKQINLDLLRTMPNNLHFMSATCKGSFIILSVNSTLLIYM